VLFLANRTTALLHGVVLVVAPPVQLTPVIITSSWLLLPILLIFLIRILFLLLLLLFLLLTAHLPLTAADIQLEGIQAILGEGVAILGRLQ